MLAFMRKVIHLQIVGWGIPERRELCKGLENIFAKIEHDKFVQG